MSIVIHRDGGVFLIARDLMLGELMSILKSHVRLFSQSL